MVFKPFTHLARQSLGKTFTHGYAQSVVAATQSSYASSTTPFGPFGSHATTRFTKHGNSQLHQSFQHPSTPSAVNANTNQHGLAHENSPADSGLAAYYEAWQNQQRSSGTAKEWKQFQFPLRIGWKAPSTFLDRKSTDKDNTRLRADTLVERSGLDRAYSTSVVDDIKKAEDVAAETAAVAQVDEAIAKEISTLHNPPLLYIAPDNVTPDEVALRQGFLSTNSTLSISPGQSSNVTSSAQSSLLFTDDTIPTPDTESLSHQISQLRDAKRFAEIPALFELMLTNGMRPSIAAYNALLLAAIVLPTARHQAVPKALGVYTSLLRQKVLPDSAFYSTLLEFLSRKAITIFQMKAVMNLQRLRFGKASRDSSFLFRSDESEYAILSEDDALDVAVRIFNTAVTAKDSPLLSSESYDSMIKACALHDRVDDMIQIYSHLESCKVTPISLMFPAMIEAFARSGDLRSAVECYNEYKSMAIRDDAGETALVGRQDNQVYAAVVKSYAMCGKEEEGRRFFAKVIKSLDNAAVRREEQLEGAQDIITARGIIEYQTDAGNYTGALQSANEHSMTSAARNKVMARICSAAADNNDALSAVKSYQSIEAGTEESQIGALSMLALHIRLGQLDEARTYWSALSGSSKFDASLIGPTTVYSTALIASGHVDDGVLQARSSFARMRASAGVGSPHDQVKEEIDEAIELIGGAMATQPTRISPQASMNLLWAMNDNNGPVSPVSEQLLASLDPEAISTLEWQDVALLLRFEAEVISGRTILQDVAHTARFEYLLDLTIQRALPLDSVTTELVERTLATIGAQRPHIVNKWHHALRIASRSNDAILDNTPAPSPSTLMSTAFVDNLDPYEATTDHRGSNIIVDVLDNARFKHGANLDEALSRFRNMRRVGRHPRYVVYAKLITASAKEGRVNLVHDILGTARQDLPFVPHNLAFRDGWASILDSTVGACLTIGNRAAASEFHEELLSIGCAPTANTYGLYITTLKESTRTFDEAREALNIFRRAKSEGVEPSSFLYNALIGKLGKARRIDDCLLYFTEMRAHGIRPTSVTYGTVVNALCRVSDERHAEELFDEMESMSNYKPRPAPYNSLMQFFLTTKRDSTKVLEYYSRMLSRNIQPTMHTYKLLIDTYATLEPINMPAAEAVLNTIRASGQRPEAVHYASLVHAKGCALHDMAGARETFDAAMANPEVRPQACLYQALFESMVANHRVEGTEELLEHMASRGVEMTPYIANTLIHGWAAAHNVAKAQELYQRIGREKREPSTYEAMTRAFLSSQDREEAFRVVQEMLSRGYPSAVTNKVVDLLHQGSSRAASVAPVASAT
ncbi:MAG: hypothetical protein Q9212_005052 [Teloschistes hypoglaucus]